MSRKHLNGHPERCDDSMFSQVDGEDKSSQWHFGKWKIIGTVKTPIIAKSPDRDV